MWLEDTFRMYNVKRMNIDSTGLGKQLAEQITTAHPYNVNAKTFSRPLKESLALNLLKLTRKPNPFLTRAVDVLENEGLGFLEKDLERHVVKELEKSLGRFK